MENNNLLYERIISTPTLDGIDRVLEAMDSETVQFLFDLMTEQMENVDVDIDDENYLDMSIESNITLERIQNELFERTLHESFLQEPSLVKKEDVCLDTSNQSVKATKEHASESCYICVVNYVEDEMITQLDCEHNCHTECLNEWVKYKSECPICRCEIKTCDVKKSATKRNEVKACIINSR
jgi:hypothetical protein